MRNVKGNRHVEPSRCGLLEKLFRVATWGTWDNLV